MNLQGDAGNHGDVGVLIQGVWARPRLCISHKLPSVAAASEGAVLGVAQRFPGRHVLDGACPLLHKPRGAPCPRCLTGTSEYRVQGGGSGSVGLAARGGEIPAACLDAGSPGPAQSREAGVSGQEASPDRQRELCT